MLVHAVKALGGCPRGPELELVASALLRGPADLAAELRVAAQEPPSEASREACDRLLDIVDAGGGSPFTMLDLIVEVTQQLRVQSRQRRGRESPRGRWLPRGEP
jgi:hypothetical protein